MHEEVTVWWRAAEGPAAKGKDQTNYVSVGKKKNHIWINSLIGQCPGCSWNSYGILCSISDSRLH
jgi:hypothetical protein